MYESVPLPRGFKTAGVACGIKADPGRLDLALFLSDVPCAAAGVFTQNLVCGAPVKVSRERVPRSTARGVVINSGNANACTGERGIEDALWMAAEVAGQLGCSEDDILVCSTGVIGRFLPRENLAAGIPAAAAALGSSPDSFTNAARAIMTTDTVHKQATRTAEIDGCVIRVSGVAKGAAMIGPNMATMLSVIMTDAPLTSAEADAMLRHAVDRSFNCISVEGHTSTSDSVILLANSAAGMPRQEEWETGRRGDGEKRESLLLNQQSAIRNPQSVLQQSLDAVCEELAQAIIRDAEGAEHFITIDVKGLRTRDEAKRIAKTIAEGALVKTAITGADPNWGRIVSAAGYAGVDLREEDISLRLNGTLLYERGVPVPHDTQAVSASLRNNRDVHIELLLDLGAASIRFWTSDLTAEYVRLNADYTT